MAETARAHRTHIDPWPGAWLVLAAVTLLVHLAAARGYGFFRDEFYYLACGRHLDWGYVDHPPLIALVAWFADRVLRGSIVAVRLIPALAHAALVVATMAVARRLSGGLAAQVLAGLAALLGPVYLGAASTLNMNPMDQLLWTLCLLVLIGAVAREPGAGFTATPGATAPGPPLRAWLLFGALGGLGLLNKHSLAFFVAALGAGLLISPQRRWLRAPGPWIALGLAFAIASPNAIWEIAHGWPTLEFLRNAAEKKNYAGAPLEFTVAQAIVIHPINALLALVGLAGLFVRRDLARFRFVAWTFVATFALLLALKAKHYYLAPAYPPLFAAGAVTLERLGTRGRALAIGFAVVLVLLAAPFVPAVLPLLPPERYLAYTRALHVPQPQSERHRMGPLPQQFADMFGWPELAAQVANVVHALPPEEQKRCVVFASNYGEAGALQWYGRGLEMPPVGSGHNNYFLWGPPDTNATVVVTVGEDSSDVAESFYDVRPAGVFHHPYVMPYENDLTLYVGRRPRMTWRQIWPFTKKYI